MNSRCTPQNAAQEPEDPRPASPRKILEPFAEHGSDDEGPPSDREPDREAQAQSQARAGSSKSTDDSDSLQATGSRSRYGRVAAQVRVRV
ncbi:hypothetical protein EVG20_g5934 [Dentipellis fragilis]|uniref:Uncharacterized protein n=1 Tax=Dentipellis fragilis TaxID=205917 RepID=A0A4Y9YPU9_9AGAM|nr:hypothetical protein EVG20_g5934 [Dentipellis fragilis]